MELELRKLEDLSESIVNDFAEMKRREEEHRDTNGRSGREPLNEKEQPIFGRNSDGLICPHVLLCAESTNERLLHFSIFSMVCLLVLAVWQVLYLKRYFKQKKLI